MFGRPSEALQAYVGLIVAAILAVLDVELSPQKFAAIVFLVSLVAAGVTAFVAKRQREGDLNSAVDGKVLS